jgi:hypothetical protein
MTALHSTAGFWMPTATLFAALTLGGEAVAFQLTFSVTYEGPTISVLNSGQQPTRITEADLLTFGPGAPGFPDAAGPLAPPRVVLHGDVFGLINYNQCQGHPPGNPCGIEVDSISQGLDPQLVDFSQLTGGRRLWFSVDEWAAGDPISTTSPDVASEAPAGDSSADIFVEFGLGLGPVGPSAGMGTHVGVFDGDGVRSAAPAGNLYPGMGLIEPNTPMPGLPDLGDDVDALDIATVLGFPPGGYFVSLDSAFFDPLEGVPNTGTAALQGVSGADVLLVASPGAAPSVFASAAALGLDFFGVDSDDLDALVLSENGDGVFQPSATPYDWTSGGTDMLLFSVRRGSAVIGSPDSIFGVPIEAGDVLTTPLSGGLSLFPGILFAAESLGLRTVRTHGGSFGDDLNAMDISVAACFDCNNNGVEDSVDISTGASSDVDSNGIPDECEDIDEYCACPSAPGSCANSDPGAGCTNSTGGGAHLFSSGTASVLADDLVLNVDGLPTGQPGIFYMGGNQIALPFGDGLRCVGGGGAGIFRYPAQSNSSGVVSRGPGIVALSCSSFSSAGCIASGSTWNFQFWYRDPAGPCGGFFNLSNGLAVSFGL